MIKANSLGPAELNISECRKGASFDAKAQVLVGGWAPEIFPEHFRESREVQVRGSPWFMAKQPVRAVGA